MTEPDPRAEIERINENILHLVAAKASGAIPAAVADASIAALKKERATHEAQLTGDGAVAQGDGAKAVGKNGILIEGSFQGNIYMGGEIKDNARALEIYRHMIRRSTSNLPLRGVDVGAADPSQAQQSIGLANIYVDLNTTTHIREDDLENLRNGKLMSGAAQNPATLKVDAVTVEWDENNPRREAEDVALPVLGALTANQHLVLLGDPGSGKSTFVNFLAFCLAANALEPKAGWLEHLKGWRKEESDLIPVIITLRDFARLYADDLPEKATVSHLWSFIVSRLKANNLERAAEPILTALETGKAILLFDGLDEVPTRAQRIFVRDAVRAFTGQYHQCRALITCRVLSYQEPGKGKPDLRLTEFPTYEISEFNEEQIDNFVSAWYAELARLGSIKAEEEAALTNRLQTAVRRRDLQELSPNPLLLTVMALVHTHKGKLPDARALLYEETIEILLWRWEQIKLGGQEDAPRMRQYLLEAGRTDVDLKAILWRLAYEAHASVGGDDDGNKLADIPEHRIINALASLKCDDKNPDGDLNWAKHIVDLMKSRAGLLLEREPGIFTFPHRTFQEYMAGAHLASQTEFAATATHLTEQKALWREVILFAIGKLVYVSGEIEKSLGLAAELCPDESLDTDLAWWRAWLAGDVLQEIGVNRVKDRALGRDLLKRVRYRLKDLLEKTRLAPRERADAGNTLSQLGDPRFNPDLWHLPADETLGFVRIPAGKFLMGSDDKDKQADDDEKPQHEVELPEYWMAKYPVTVAQFRAFTEATKYKFDRWGDNQISTHPAVSVNWYDALEYSKWLDSELRKVAKEKLQAGEQNPFWQGMAEGKLQVTLPSEAEWEKAARGMDGRIYPWGDDFDPDKANTDPTGIGTTSTVGCFPAFQHGLYDMSGNVWEWTRSISATINGSKIKDNSYPYIATDGREDLSKPRECLRGLRGGSFIVDSLNSRCAFRYGYDPDFGYWGYGFRVVVVSPGLLS